MKPKKHCSVQDCTSTNRIVRGMCISHYSKWRLYGDPLKGRPTYASADEAFQAKTEWVGECLIWTGFVNSKGYGRFSFGGKSIAPHRYAWELQHGKIPAGMVIDHEDHCDPACCNVEHLRLATSRQNNYNRSGPSKANKTSGYRNVSWSKAAQKWTVTVGRSGKVHYFGLFDDLEEAASVAEKARQELFGEYAGKG